jgi:hypothetical protein
MGYQAQELTIFPFEPSHPTQIMVSPEDMTKLFFAGVGVPSNIRLNFAAQEEENSGEMVLAGSYQESPGSEGVTLFQVEYMIQIPAQYGPSGQDTVMHYRIENQDLKGIRASLEAALEGLVDRLVEWQAYSIHKAEAPEPESPIVSESTGPGVLEIVGPWCFVYLDGKLVGTSSAAKLILEPGEHTIGLFSPCYGYKEVMKVVRPGERVVLEFGR